MYERPRSVLKALRMLSTQASTPYQPVMTPWSQLSLLQFAIGSRFQVPGSEQLCTMAGRLCPSLFALRESELWERNIAL